MRTQSRRDATRVTAELARRPAFAFAFAFALALALAPAPARAQAPDSVARPDTLQLPDLVVTATRVPLRREALPTPVTVLTGEELRADGVRTVADALRRVPGAALAQAGAPGAQTSLFLRGGESDYVKVLIDGVPVNDPGGAFDFADLSTDQIERIEVVRGPASVLYGSDAVAGVVQLFTRRGAGEPRVTVSATGGRGAQRHGGGGYGVADASASVTGGAGEVRYAAGAARSWSEGLYPLNSARDLTTATGRVSWTPAAGAELAVSTRLSDSRSGFPTDGTGALVDRNARIDRRLWTTSLEAGLRLHERVDARLRFGLATRRQDARDPMDGPTDTLDVYSSDLSWDVARRSADARVNVELPRSVLTAGVVLERADAESRYASESQWGPTSAAADYDRANTGYYLQLLAEPLSGAHLTAGARLDDNQAFGAFATYRLGLSVRVLPHTRLRAALGRAFREPTFDENYGSGFGDRGNPALEPERSRSRELGVEQELRPGVVVGATWFDQRFRDLVQFTFAPPEPDGPNYFNVGEARARGVELEADITAGRVGATASYTWLDTEVLDPGLASDASFAEGQALLRRPAHSGTLSARYGLEAGILAASLHVAGERDDLDFSAGFPAPRVTLPAHATVDLSAEHALPFGAGPRTELLLRVENVLDASYEAVRGFPAPGRVARIGVRVAL